MSMIPRSKTGDCSECGERNTACVKVGKSLYCLNCNKRNKVQQWMNNQTKKTSRQILTSNDIIDDLDFVFSRYIRIKESDKNGSVSCYTCGKIHHWKELQCGHFIKRGHMQLRWDSRNARPQCIECNCSQFGNIEQYEKNLNDEQQGLPEQLREISREVYKYSREELKELLAELRAKLAIVESRFVK